jgi:flagellar hook-associated protein 3 FlgL
MRITNRMLHDRALSNLERNVEALSRVQEQVATTKRLQRPSDDPTDVRSAVKTSELKAELERYQRNIVNASRAMSTAEGALASAGEVIQRVRELAIQGANGSLSSGDRSLIAQEVEQLTGQLVALAATRAGDQYLFSGYQTDKAPYGSPPPGTAVVGAYLGDSGALVARIGPGVQVGVNVTADVVFGPAFAALAQLHGDLVGGGPATPAAITMLDAGQAALLAGRSLIGARQNRLDQTATTLDDALLATQRVLSELVDVDLTEAITALSQREAVYQAALEVNGRLLQSSLIDHLR